MDARNLQMAPTDARAIVDAVASALHRAARPTSPPHNANPHRTRLAPTLDAHYYRGGLDVLRGDGQSALPHLRAAIRLDPQHADAYYELRTRHGRRRRQAPSARCGRRRRCSRGTPASSPTSQRAARRGRRRASARVPALRSSRPAASTPRGERLPNAEAGRAAEAEHVPRAAQAARVPLLRAQPRRLPPPRRARRRRAPRRARRASPEQHEYALGLAAAPHTTGGYDEAVELTALRGLTTRAERPRRRALRGATRARRAMPAARPPGRSCRRRRGRRRRPHRRARSVYLPPNPRARGRASAADAPGPVQPADGRRRRLGGGGDLHLARPRRAARHRVGESGRRRRATARRRRRVAAVARPAGGAAARRARVVAQRRRRGAGRPARRRYVWLQDIVDEPDAQATPEGISGVIVPSRFHRRQLPSHGSAPQCSRRLGSTPPTSSGARTSTGDSCTRRGPPPDCISSSSGGPPSARPSAARRSGARAAPSSAARRSRCTTASPRGSIGCTRTRRGTSRGSDGWRSLWRRRASSTTGWSTRRRSPRRMRRRASISFRRTSLRPRASI